MDDNLDLKSTPLLEQHQLLNARLTAYAGWRLPVQYAGIPAEHLAVRQAAGLFDVSHMGEIEVSGADAADFLNYLLTRDLSRLQPGQARYSPMCAADGGTVDDLIVYPLAFDQYLLVVNAANTAKDLAHIQATAAEWRNRPDRPAGAGLTVADLSAGYAQLALQGPLAAGLTVRLAEGAASAITGALPDPVALTGLKPYQFVWQPASRCLVSRTGYTGEDGFEFYMPPQLAPDLWRRLLDLGAVPVGLGARDSLRMEAGLPLYGHELSPTITPLEAGLQRFVDLAKPAPGFVGQAALLDLQARRTTVGGTGPLRRLIGLHSAGRAIPRADYPVLLDARPIGHITSGGYAPSLAAGIGMALIEAGADVEHGRVSVLVREREEPFAICPLPFYKRTR